MEHQKGRVMVGELADAVRGYAAGGLPVRENLVKSLRALVCEDDLAAEDHMMEQETWPTKTVAPRAKGRLDSGRKSSAAITRRQFRVVGIGASAGGLEACTALLKALPANPGMAFVLVQHLDPHHESILHKLLSKTTDMPVVQVEEGIVLERDHVYVIPPKYDIAVRERTLRLLSRRRTAGRHLPINRFFASLAEDQKSAAIGVILSGTASDGTAGLQAIKSEGGVAFAQDPKSAGYPGMPESAILAGCVDFILPPEEIARELARLAHGTSTKRTLSVAACQRLKYTRVTHCYRVPLNTADRRSDQQSLRTPY